MHCTFCGLNGQTMTYRSNSPQRLLGEISVLGEKYGRNFVSVDNILDLRYLSTFFPELVARGANYSFHYETKTNLKKPQLKLLRDAGVRHLQPGIESLSTPILKLMKKGCTLLQNLQCLKWCHEYGIKVAWNFLYGFPGEDPQEYERMAQLIPSLLHLDPPSYCTRVRMDRHSPYFSHSVDYGFSNIRPQRAYSYVYPFGEDVLKNMAYFFEFDHDLQETVDDYTRHVVSEVAAWQSGAHRGNLASTLRYGQLVLSDTRKSVDSPEIVLTEPLSLAYAYCDEARSLANIQQHLKNQRCEMKLEELRGALDGLVQQRLMVAEGLSYLSLAVPSF